MTVQRPLFVEDVWHVLTVLQPWASALVTPTIGKDVENRSIRTHYRGRLYIHAGAHRWGGVIHHRDPETQDLLRRLADEGLRGMILGHVELYDCVRDFTSPWAMHGLWHWLVRDPVLLPKPIPARGARRIWRFKYAT